MPKSEATNWAVDGGGVDPAGAVTGFADVGDEVRGAPDTSGACDRWCPLPGWVDCPLSG